eukprot:tig00020556_g11033.t1
MAYSAHSSSAFAGHFAPPGFGQPLIPPPQPTPPQLPPTQLPFHSRLLTLDSVDTESLIGLLLRRRKPDRAASGWFDRLFASAPNPADYGVRVRPLQTLPNTRRPMSEVEFFIEKSTERGEDLLVHVRSPFAGQVSVEVLHRGEMVAQHVVNVAPGPPDPQRTSVELFGGAGELVGDEREVGLVVFALDAYGNPTMRGAGQLRAHVFSPSGGVRELQGRDFSAHPPGDYGASVPLGDELGEYTIVVTLAGVEVSGSPLAVQRAGRHREAIARALQLGEATYPVYVPDEGAQAAAAGLREEDERGRRAHIIASSSSKKMTFAGYNIDEFVGAVETGLATARGYVNTVAEAAEEIARQAEARPGAPSSSSGAGASDPWAAAGFASSSTTTGRPSGGGGGGGEASSRSLVGPSSAASSSRGLALAGEVGAWATGVAAALGLVQPREKPRPGEQEAELRVSRRGVALSTPFLLLGARVLFEWPLLPGLRVEAAPGGEPGLFEVRCPEWPPVPFRCSDPGEARRAACPRAPPPRLPRPRTPPAQGHAAAALLRRLVAATGASERAGRRALATPTSFPSARPLTSAGGARSLEGKRRLLRAAIVAEGSPRKSSSGPFGLQLDGSDEEDAVGRRGARGRRDDSLFSVLFGPPVPSISSRGLYPGEVGVRVRRTHVLEDSISKLHSAARFKRKLRIRFEGEEGVDAGGVTADWFDTVARALYAEPHRLFVPFERSRLLHPNPVSILPGSHGAEETYTFVGRFLGRALRETLAGAAPRPLALYFSRSFYKMLLGVPVSLADLESDDPETYERRIRYVLEHALAESGLEELAFAEELHGPGGKLLDVVELKKGGRRIRVTDRSKHEYCALLASWLVEGRVAPLVRYVRRGLFEMVEESALRLLTPNELELLLCGVPKIDVADMRKNTVIDGCPARHRVVEWFWRAVGAMSKEDLALLLQFATGSSRLPLGGFGALEPRFTVRLDEEAGPPAANRLPRAQTCFHRLLLPHYASGEQLRRCLATAIRETQGFGFA